MTVQKTKSFISGLLIRCKTYREQTASSCRKNDHFSITKSFAIAALALVGLFGNSASAQTQLWGMTSDGGPYSAGTIFSTDATGNNHTVQHAFYKKDGFFPGLTNLIRATDGNLYGFTPNGGVYSKGVLFQYQPATGTYTKKVEFSGANGSEPYGALIQAADGNLYGMTKTGGVNNLGVLFQYNPANGNFAVKVSFAGASNGSKPHGSLIQATDGNLYGMTNEGGANNFGVLFQYNIATSTYTKKHDFDGTNGSKPYGSLMQATDGNMYGMTSLGGANDFGVLFQFNPGTNAYSKKIDFAGTSNGSHPFGSLMQATDGHFYGMTYDGGINDWGVMFQYNLTANTLTKKIDFLGASNGTQPYGSLMQASDGNLYGMTFGGGSASDGTLFQYNPNTNTYSKKIDFSETAYGRNPEGALMQTPDGKLYGMTLSGGIGGYGVLFQYNPVTNSLIKKVEFAEAANGSAPYGSLMKATNGNLYGLTQFGGVNNMGTLFQYNASTNTYIKKIDFAGALNGDQPTGSLMQASDGNLYGMTQRGGSTNNGVLFQFDPVTNNFIKKFDFAGFSNGSSPYGSLIQLPDGLMYGMTYSGGANNLGVLFQYNPSTNTFTKKVDFTIANGCNPYGSLVLASDGNLYGMTSQGGANNYGVLFQYDPNLNIYTKKIDFTGSNGTGPFGSLLLASDDYLYGMTIAGGANNLGVLFRYNFYNNSYLKLLDFDGTTKGSSPHGALMQALDGNLYGLTAGGGTNDIGVLFQFNPLSFTYTKKLDFDGTNGKYPIYGNLIEINNNCTAPDIICQGNQAVYASSNCNAVVNYSASVTGTTPISITYNFDGATTGNGTGNGSGSTFNKGVTTVTLTASNACGSKNCSFYVYVNDSAPPVFASCPLPAIVVERSGLQCAAQPTLSTPVVTEPCSVPSGNSLDFDTSTIIWNSPPTLTNWTIESWVYMHQLPTTWSTVFGFYQGYLGLYINSIGGLEYYYGYNNEYLTSSTVLDTNRWYHIAVTYNGNQIKLYIDGTLNASVAASVVDATISDTSILIGTFNLGGDELPLIGKLDEMRIWNYARTSANIQANMNNELNAQGGLIALYHFNQGIPEGNNTSITNVTDASGYGNHASMSNFILTGKTSNFVNGWTVPDVTSNAPTSFPLGNTTVIWTAIDQTGNKSSCSQSVYVISPEINVQGNSVTIADNDVTPDAGDHTDFGNVPVSAVHTYTIQNSGTATLNVSSVLVSGGDASMFTVGSLTPASLILSGNSASFTVTFTPASLGLKSTTVHINTTDCDEGDYDFAIQGNGVPCNTPTITCPGNQAAIASTNCNAVVNYTATYTGTTPVAISYVFAGATTGSGTGDGNGSTFLTGTTNVTLTATNACGNSSCTFDVVVSDTTAPTITCPALANLNVNQSGCTADASLLGTPVVTDNCSALTPTNNVSGNFSVGNHSVTWTVADAAGNTNSCQQAVVVNSTLDLIVHGTNNICLGSPAATISAQASGNSSNFFYQWGNGTTIASRTISVPGTFTVTVTDDYGCTLSGTTSVQGVSYNISSNKIRCNGASTGTATVNITKGTAPFTYLWMPGIITLQTANNLSAGTYTVTVTDGIGCSRSRTVTISENPPLILNAAQTGLNQATATASGGVPPYSYKWLAGPPQYSATATGLVNGHVYKVKVTDAKNCTATTLITMAAPKQLPEENDFYLSPNPTKGIVSIVNNCTSCEFYDVKIYNAIGGKLLDEKRSVSQLQFDLSKYQNGLYLFEIKAGTKRKIIKVVLE